MNLQPVNNIATQIKVILGTKLIELQRRASGNLINSLNHTIIPQG